MELAATKLKEFADDYTLNTNKPMDLVFFKASFCVLCACIELSINSIATLSKYNSSAPFLP
jgi:hypothetical protein